MSKLDPFSAQIVDMVRNHMSDEAILALVRNQLGVAMPAAAPAPTRAAKPAAPRKTAARKAAPKKATRKAAPKKTRAPKKAGGSRAAARERLLSAVARVVVTNKGLSASEIAGLTKISQNRVSSALRELKAAKTIHQGGDRRFARYAGDAKTANAASKNARLNASGPKRKATKKRGKAKRK